MGESGSGVRAWLPDSAEPGFLQEEARLPSQDVLPGGFFLSLDPPGLLLFVPEAVSCLPHSKTTIRLNRVSNSPSFVLKGEVKWAHFTDEQVGVQRGNSPSSLRNES